MMKLLVRIECKGPGFGCGKTVDTTLAVEIHDTVGHRWLEPQDLDAPAGWAIGGFHDSMAACPACMTLPRVKEFMEQIFARIG